jgi:hypothetical protein
LYSQARSILECALTGDMALFDKLISEVLDAVRSTK